MAHGPLVCVGFVLSSTAITSLVEAGAGHCAGCLLVRSRV